MPESTPADDGTRREGTITRPQSITIEELASRLKSGQEKGGAPNIGESFSIVNSFDNWRKKIARKYSKAAEGQDLHGKQALAAYLTREPDVLTARTFSARNEAIYNGGIASQNVVSTLIELGLLPVDYKPKHEYGGPIAKENPITDLIKTLDRDPEKPNEVITKVATPGDRSTTYYEVVFEAPRNGFSVRLVFAKLQISNPTVEAAGDRDPHIADFQIVLGDELLVQNANSLPQKFYDYSLPQKIQNDDKSRLQ